MTVLFLFPKLARGHILIIGKHPVKIPYGPVPAIQRNVGNAFICIGQKLTGTVDPERVDVGGIADLQAVRNDAGDMKFADPEGMTDTLQR